MCVGGAKDFLKFQGKTEIRCKPIPGKQKKVTCYKKNLKSITRKRGAECYKLSFSKYN